MRPPLPKETAHILTIGILLILLIIAVFVLQKATFLQDVFTQSFSNNQPAALGWAIRNTSLKSYRGNPAPTYCGLSPIGDNPRVCLQTLSKSANIYGVFSVNEKRFDTNGAARYFKAYTAISSQLGWWRLVWSMPHVTINGTAYGAAYKYGADAFAIATFRSEVGGQNNANKYMSANGKVYTLINSSPFQTKNRDAVENGLLQLGTQTYSLSGTGITIAAGTPVDLEWSCQPYQVQLTVGYCDPAVGVGALECSAARLIDGFNKITSNFGATAAQGSYTATNIYKDTTLWAQCLSREKSGSKRAGTYVSGGWAGNALIQWSIDSRPGPRLSLDVTTVNQIGDHNLTANPTPLDIGYHSQLDWKAVWAQRCRVTGQDVDTGWLYGSNCHNPDTINTPNFTSPGDYQYTLTYVTYDSQGNQTVGHDYATVHVNDATQPPDTGGTGTTTDPGGGDTGGGGGGGATFTDLQLVASDRNVRIGETITLDWDTGGRAASDCSLTGPRLSGYAPLSDQSGTTDEVAVFGESDFTLSCIGSGSDEKTITVHVIPRVFES